MNVHYTGRQQSVTPEVRKQVEARLDKLQKVFGPRTKPETHVILGHERHLHTAEITLNVHDHTIVGTAETANEAEALTLALDHLEKQALRQKAKWRAKTRHGNAVSARSIRTLQPAT
jgi:ribosomal subunit interface protein